MKPKVTKRVFIKIGGAALAISLLPRQDEPAYESLPVEGSSEEFKFKVGDQFTIDGHVLPDGSLEVYTVTEEYDGNPDSSIPPSRGSFNLAAGKN